MTIQLHITDISADIVIKFSRIFKNCIKFSLVLDESIDITFIEQLCIYARCITSDYEIMRSVQ